jgi:radical SAM superfamily enzyme YgiQ (UPF0313 family)
MPYKPYKSDVFCHNYFIISLTLFNELNFIPPPPWLFPAFGLKYPPMQNTSQDTFRCVPEESKKADILLIYPDFAKNSLGTASYPENHLGLNRLATYLDQKGYAVKVLNTTGRAAGTKGPEDLATFLLEHSGDFPILGFHANSWNISHIVRILELIKSAYVRKPILFGGPLPTAEPEKIIRLGKDLGYENIGLVQGYGEFALEKIMRNPLNLAGIKEVWSSQKGRESKGTLQRFTPEETGKIPPLNPRYNTFFQLYYRPFLDGSAKEEMPVDAIYTAQGLDVNHGCPFNCSYCSVHIYGNTVSEYTPQRVCDELESLAKETGFFMFTFTNSNLLFLRRQWAVDFCEEIIKRNMHHYLSWSGYHHPNTINLLSTEDLKLMKKAGCDQIVVGIQSVDPKVLDLFNRPKSTYKIFKEIREKTASAGLELVIDYIRGVPGENLDIVEEFYDYCITNRIELREFLLKIYPNTDIKKKDIDFNGYELIPITGNLAPELDSYAVIPKKDDPRNAVLTQKINASNREILRNRKIRLGLHYLSGEAQAKELKDNIIPKDPHIPEKVKTAMIRMLEKMLAPQKTQNPFVNLSPQEMMKNLILADENAPPIVKKMQERLRAELGEEKFRYLRKKYSGNN